MKTAVLAHMHKPAAALESAGRVAANIGKESLLKIIEGIELKFRKLILPLDTKSKGGLAWYSDPRLL